MEMKEYEGQVFSIEQMQELEAMGIDVSNASCMWNSIQDKDYKPLRFLLLYLFLLVLVQNILSS